jgi:hypothetical protein
MTDAEWDASLDPERMLAAVVGKVPDAGLRLFAARCCRRVAKRLSESWRRGIDVAERFARDDADGNELAATLRALAADFEEIIESDNGEIYAAKEAVLAALCPESPFDPRETARAASRSMGAEYDDERAAREEQCWQAGAIHGMFTDQSRCSGRRAS